MSEKDKILIGYKGVKYGLQKRKPEAPAAAPRLAEFADDSSDEEDVSQQLNREQEKNLKASKVAAAREAALAEDSTVFEYDSVYDEMQKSKVDPRKEDVSQRKPKYIQQLMQKAEVRKKEQDIAYERRLLKERKAEDHLYTEKEAFLTEAYKNKLVENKYWIQREQMMDAAEEREDVTKKKDLTGFYQNLCRNNVAFASNQLKDPEEATPEPTPLPENLQDIVDQRIEQPKSPPVTKVQVKPDPEPKTGTLSKADVEEVVETKIRKRNNDQTIASARERYLARRQSQQDS